MSSRTTDSASSRDQRDAHAGCHEALHGLVVVALEGHPRLEACGVAAAHDVARAGAGSGGLHPGVVAQICKAQPLPCRRADVRAAGPGTSDPRTAPRGSCRAASARLPGNSNSSARSSSPAAQARRDLLGLALDERQLDVGVGGAEGGDRQRHQRRPGGGEGGHPQAPPAQPGDRRQRRLGGVQAREDALGVADQRLPGGGQADPARVALEQRQPGFGLERGDLLGDGRLACRRAPRRPRRSEPR